MKFKTILLPAIALALLLQFATLPVLGQWTTSGTDIYNSNAGEVGIGNTAPTYQLDVLGLNTSRALNVNSTYAGASSKYGIYTTLSDAGTSSRYGLYSTVTAAAGNANTAYGLRSLVTHNGTGSIYGVYSSVAGSGTGARYGIYSSASGSSNYAFYGLGRAYISDKLGVGVTNPVGKIHASDVEVDLASGGSLILGTTTSTNMAFDANEIMVRNNGASGVLYLNPLGSAVVINNSGAADASLSTDGALRLGETSSANMVLDGNEIMARNNGAASSLYLNRDGGNIYIGTGSGSEKLNVCGGIQAEEVRVSSGWCDYVFEKDYDLMSLEELEFFVQEKKHLPNIPPASEIQANGLPLADATTRMMEKVEELTLYVLQLNHRLKEVEQENELLRVLLTNQK
jgi:hypothetical protein